MTSTDVLIRTATSSDAASVRSVIERAIRVSARTEYSPAQIEAWASGGSDAGTRVMIEHSIGFVAEINGRVVGFANLVDADVDQLYVDPDSGGRGVARRLYLAVERAALAQGLQQLTATASLRAEPAFARFGFEPVEHITRRFNGEHFPVVLMVKSLIGQTGSV